MNWEVSFLYELSQRGVGDSSMSWLSWIMAIFTHSVEGGLIWIVLGVVFICFKKTRKCGIALGIGLLVFALLFNDIFIKYTIQRIRPLYNLNYPTESLYLLSNLESTPYFINEGKGFLGLFEIPGKGSYSFMSGHSFTSFLCATIVFAYYKKAGIFCYIYAAVVAFSRLYFGVHYPSDVIVGAIAGIMLGIVCYCSTKIVLDKIYSSLSQRKKQA